MFKEIRVCIDENVDEYNGEEHEQGKRKTNDRASSEDENGSSGEEAGGTVVALRQRLSVVETEYEAVVQEKEREIEQLRQQIETVEAEHEAALRERERERLNS